MGIFSRKRDGRAPVADPGAIPALWDWWSTSGRAAADRALQTGDWGRFPDDVTARVRAIHPDLEWETGRGVGVEHALVISAGGVGALRPLAERCVRAAPPADGVWEYHPARQPSADWHTGVLRLSGGGLALSDSRVALLLDGDRLKADVTVYHPGFVRLGEDDRARAAFLLLDRLLGEDGVERWVGRVTTTAEMPADALPAGALPETVQAMADRAGDDQWAHGRGVLRGRPIMFTARRPLKWIDNPLLDVHVAVAVPYRAGAADGLPDGPLLDDLRRFEDELVARTGARGLLVAHETSAGVRTFHLYVDSADAGALALVSAVADQWPGARVEHAADPGWSSVAAFS